MTRSKKIAVTGGIGSGKTTFCKLLKEKGYPVYSCDGIYAELLDDGEYLNALSMRFSDCFTGGVLNKVRLSERVFSSEEDRLALEALAHPRVMRRLMERMGEGLSFAEVPLLFEGGFEGLFDEVIALVRKEELRLDGVTKRDGIPREEVLSRMAAQLPPSELKNKNCIIVANDGTVEELSQKADEVIKRLGV